MKIYLSFLLLSLLILTGCEQIDNWIGRTEPPKFPEAPKPTCERGEEKVIITWTEAKGAENYKVYRSNRANGDYTQVGSVTKRRYEDTNVKSDTTYFYKVTSVNSDGRENDVVQPISCKYIPLPPEVKVFVTNLRHGEPVTDVKVEIEGEGFLETRQTDDSGRTVFILEKEGIYNISAEKKGFISTKLEEIDIREKDELEIILRPIPQVIGNIADPANPFRVPAYVAFSSDGNRAFVTNQFGNNVSVIDVSTDKVLRTVDVGNEPLGLAVNPVKPELYVVNYSDGTVSIIDTNNCKVIGEPVKVGKLPTQAVVNIDGTEVYVVNSGSNTVSIVELAELPHESKQIDVGRTPYGIAKSPDDRYLYVTNEADDTVSVVSLSTESIEQTIPVGNAPKDVAVGRDGRYVLVSNHLSANLAVIDLKVLPPEVMMHEVGRLPMGIAIISEPDHPTSQRHVLLNSQTAYITLKAEAGVRIFDFAEMQIVDEPILIGTSPVGIAAHPNGEKIYVANSDGESVTVLGY